MKKLVELLNKTESICKDNKMIPLKNFANGSLFSRNAHVVCLQSFKEWMQMRCEELKETEKRIGDKEDFEFWFKPQIEIFNESMIQKTETIEDLINFEKKVRSEYFQEMHEFVMLETKNKKGSHEEIETNLAKKSAYSEILTNFCYAMFLDEKYKETKAAEQTKYFKEMCYFPK